MFIEVGSQWVCEQESYPYFNMICEVLEVNDHSDYNGDGEILVLYENNEEITSKVRRFALRHKRIKSYEMPKFEKPTFDEILDQIKDEFKNAPITGKTGSEKKTIREFKV